MPARLQIPDELAAEMTPAVRAFVDVLLQRIADLEAEIAALNKTPRNSSVETIAERTAQRDVAAVGDDLDQQLHDRRSRPGGNQP